MANPLIEKIKKNSTIKETEIITKSKVWGKSSMDVTPYPNVNLALSGRLDGGMVAGHHVIAGPSRHYKSGFALMLAGAYMKKYPDSVMLFYDSEFGVTTQYFDTNGIDMERVIHTPILTVEGLRTDIMNQLQDIKRGDKIIIVIDSVGNLPSLKETEDAISGSEAADFTRARMIKSLFRMVTPHLEPKDIRLITIQHTYTEMKQYGKTIISGGSGVMLSANLAWIIGRAKNEEDKVINGYDFKIKIEKSRFHREGSIIPITIRFDTGVLKYSGLLPLALKTGHIKKQRSKSVSYEFEGFPNALFSEEEVNDSTDDQWKYLFEKTDFPAKVRELYEFGGTEDLVGDEIVFVNDPEDPLND